MGMERAREIDGVQPTYGAAFRCSGPDCEDHCCREWEIPLDRGTYAAYRQFPPEKLGNVVSEFVILNPAGSLEGMFARIERRPSGQCAFLEPDRLCGIQKDYGPKLLSASCSIYPRLLSRVGGRLEATLSLSCPEAARNVMLNPEFLRVGGDLESPDFRTDNFYLLEPENGATRYKPYRWFGPVRALILDLVRDRARPVWQRLFLVGILCLRLDEVTAASQGEAIPAILAEFERILTTGALRDELETMVAQPQLRLDFVAKLLEERAREEVAGSRLLATWQLFEQGRAAALDAERLFYRPWMDRHPHVLENYLLNYVLQNLFPFGREGSAQSSPQSLADEFLLLTVQFASVEVLLAGVAGYWRNAFAAEHVVAAVQSYTRAVEHYPALRRAMVETVRQRGLGGLEGVAILLKPAQTCESASSL